MKFNFSRSSFAGDAHSNRTAEGDATGTAPSRNGSPSPVAKPRFSTGSAKPSRTKSLRPILAGKILAGVFVLAGICFGLFTPMIWFGLFVVATGALLFGLVSVLAGVQEYTMSEK